MAIVPDSLLLALPPATTEISPAWERPEPRAFEIDQRIRILPIHPPTACDECSEGSSQVFDCQAKGLKLVPRAEAPLAYERFEGENHHRALAGRCGRCFP